MCHCRKGCFFFSSRRRHTRSLCDWSSDVCSSDLTAGVLAALHVMQREPERRECLWVNARRLQAGLRSMGFDIGTKIGRASCRERVEMLVVVERDKKKDGVDEMA